MSLGCSSSYSVQTSADCRPRFSTCAALRLGALATARQGCCTGGAMLQAAFSVGGPTRTLGRAPARSTPGPCAWTRPRRALTPHSGRVPGGRRGSRLSWACVRTTSASASGRGLSQGRLRPAQHARRPHAHTCRLRGERRRHRRQRPGHKVDAGAGLAALCTPASGPRLARLHDSELGAALHLRQPLPKAGVEHEVERREGRVGRHGRHQAAEEARQALLACYRGQRSQGALLQAGR